MKTSTPKQSPRSSKNPSLEEFHDEYEIERSNRRSSNLSKLEDASLERRRSREQKSLQEGSRRSQTLSRLALARDSIVLQISTNERKSILEMSRTVDELKAGSDKQKIGEEEIEETEHELDTGEDELTETPEYKAGRPSKLVLAQDSLELIKNVLSSSLPKAKSVDQKRKSPTSPKKKDVKGKEKNKLKKTPRGKKPSKPASIKAPSKTKEKPSEFTEQRIKSLVDMMKESPSLIRLFTPCRQ